MRSCRHAQPQRGGVLRRRRVRRHSGRGAGRRRARLPADDLVGTRPARGDGRRPGHLDGAGGAHRLPRGRPVHRGRDPAGPVGGVRSADRGRALVAPARCRRHDPGALPQPGRPRGRGLAYRGQLPARRAPAGQRQFPGPRAAGALPAERRRRRQRADPDPSRVAPRRGPRAGSGRRRRTSVDGGGDGGGRGERGPLYGARNRGGGRRVPVPPVASARRLLAAPGEHPPDDGAAGRRPARPVPADGPAQPGRASDTRRHRPAGGPGTATRGGSRARRRSSCARPYSRARPCGGLTSRSPGPA
jgi:hypothetical protein